MYLRYIDAYLKWGKTAYLKWGTIYIVGKNKGSELRAYEDVCTKQAREY